MQKNIIQALNERGMEHNDTMMNTKYAEKYQTIFEQKRNGT